MKKRALFLSLLSLTFIAGCGENSFEGQEDKNSTEAQQFDISQALDTGDYATVLNDPNANAIDYAAAAMGLAGLDPVKLIQAMNDMSTTGQQNDLGAVTALKLNPAALDELQTAKAELAAELAANPTDPDLNFQMTLVSLTSTLTALAQVGQNTGTVAGGNIDSAEATALGNYIIANGDQSVSVDVKDRNGNDLPDTLVNLIAADAQIIIGTPGNLSDPGTLAGSNLGTGDLNKVLTDALSGTNGIDPGGNGVTISDITTYLNTQLGK